MKHLKQGHRAMGLLENPINPFLTVATPIFHVLALDVKTSERENVKNRISRREKKSLVGTFLE